MKSDQCPHGRHRVATLACGYVFMASLLAGCGEGQPVESSTDSSASTVSSAQKLEPDSAPAGAAEKFADSQGTAKSSEGDSSIGETVPAGGDSAAQSNGGTDTVQSDPKGDTVGPDSDSGDTNQTAQAESKPDGPQPTKLPSDLLEGSKLTPLNPHESVLLDLAGKRVLLKAEVCLTQGLLEMLLCPKHTKEHESILAINAKAYTIHTGLLAIGCTEGKAAKYDPDTGVFTPPSGQVVDVFLHWTDEMGNLHREKAQHWVRHSRQRYYEAEFEKLPADLKLVPDGNLRYDDMNRVIFWYGPMSAAQRDECLKMSQDEKFRAAIKRFHEDSQARQMQSDWVFVGSGFYEDGDSGKQYLAEGGYLICVANFAMAMMDVGSPSDSNGTESLAFEAWTERIPPRESEVLIELVPRQNTGSAKSKADEAPAEATPSTSTETEVEESSQNDSGKPSSDS